MPHPSELQIIARARLHGDRIAIRAGGQTYGYADLLERSATLAAALLDGTSDLEEARVVFIAPAGFEYLAIQWAIWRAGGVAVPLPPSATEPELDYGLADSAAGTVLVTRELAERIRPLCSRHGARLVVFEEAAPDTVCPMPEIDSARRAMILYTSGTTSKPKGVVTTHDQIQAQIQSLVEAWKWSSTDRIPLFLPLHHIHGIINVMSCALWSGALIEAFRKFETPDILSRVAAKAYTMFMAVPTIYVKLIEVLESGDLPAVDRAEILQGFASMRVMVSGSAALPPSVYEKWKTLTGQSLLERYGMTESGMAISNPLYGERRPGTVGQPLPEVEVRLKSENGELIISDDEPGEIQVRGPGIFREYWNRPKITADSFDDGWFRTGDMAVLENGYYRILGRLSVDIIKSGGYKLSALEIEAALIEHPSIRECAVVGLKDATWGEIVAVVVALEKGCPTLDIEALRHWGKDRLSHYKLPKRLLLVESLPRNAMGKVTKAVVGHLLHTVHSA